MEAAKSTVPLRIAIVAACPFPSARGSQVLIRELAEGLAARGHQVHVVAYPWGEHLVPIREIMVHRPRWFAFRCIARLPWLVRKALWDGMLVITLCRVVYTKKIQVLHAHNYEGPVIAYLAKRLFGCPVVYHAHNVLSDELPAYFSRPGFRRCARIVGEVLDRIVPRLADVAVVLSPAQREALLVRSLPPERILLLPPPLPEPGEVTAKIQATLHPIKGEFVIGYAGNFDAYQDLRLLVRALCLLRQGLPEASLLVVTHDRDWTRRAPRELLASCGRLEAKVVVCRSFAEARPWLCAADVLVCPRSSWSGFPIKLLNFSAMGKPIVLSSGVAKGVGWSFEATVFEAGDVNSLAAVLLRLAQDGSVRARAARAASEFAARFPHKETVSEALEQILSWAWWFSSRRVRRLSQIPERRWGVDRYEPTSYKRADGRREDGARA